MSNEKDIRESVKKYLLTQYKDLIIKEEFGVFLDSRNDVMGVNFENIISVEIKSDKDNFTRLEKQLKTYQTFSNIVYVALDISHLKKFEEKFLTDSYIFSCIGILIYDNKELKLHKKAYRHSFKMMYPLLKSNELPIFFNYFKGKSLIPKNYETSQYLIEDIFSYREIYEISKHIFIKRFMDIEQTFPKEIFKNFEESHKNFMNWLNEDNWEMYTPKPIFRYLTDKKILKPKRDRLKIHNPNFRDVFNNINNLQKDLI